MVRLVLEQAANGLFLGSLLFLVSAGLGLLLGVGRFINLAHGSFYMLGAFTCAWLVQRGVGYWLALALAALAVGALAALLQRGVLRPLFGADPLLQVLATIGLLMAANEAALLIWGSRALSITLPPVLAQSLSLGALDVPLFRLAVIAAAAALAVLLLLLIAHTPFGARFRATAEQPALVQALGIDTSLILAGVFATGAALAALAGGVYGALTTVRTGMGEPVLLVSLAVVIVAGGRSIGGLYGAALLIGMVDTLGRAFLPDMLRALLPAFAVPAAVPAVVSALLWLIVLAVLLARAEDPLAAK
jgi:branched-chain amino acid transport system permease protein